MSCFYNSRTVLIGMAALTLIVSSCANVKKFELSEPPVVDTAVAATLKFRSKDNTGPILHSHVIRIDGAPVKIMQPNENYELSVSEGPHKLRVTCHSKSELDGNDFPFNYVVVDGSASLDLDTVAGESTCYKVSFAITNCAVVSEAEPAFCE